MKLIPGSDYTIFVSVTIVTESEYAILTPTKKHKCKKTMATEGACFALDVLTSEKR